MDDASDIDLVMESAQADYFWAPPGVAVIERPEISYTWSDRDQLFFNSVVRVRPSLADPVALVSEVLERHRGKASRWSLNPMSDTGAMRDALRAQGYEQGNGHHAYVISPAQYDRCPPDTVSVRRVDSIRDLEVLYAVRAEVFGAEGTIAAADLQRELDECTAPDARVARFVAYIGTEPVGTGGCTFFDDLSFAFIWAGGVRESWRGRGVYTALLRARLEAAGERGIDRLGLYARDSTSGPIVAAHGFERHGRMTHWNRAL